MSEQHCLTCGTWGPVELHHPAGRHNVQGLVVPVCPPDHRILTSWQYAAGIELHEDAPRTPEEIRRALLVGVLQVVHLAALRDPTSSAGLARTAQLAARAVSKVLDLAGGAQRQGRWLPDATIDTVAGVEPVPISELGATVQLREIGHLVASLMRLLGDLPVPITAEQWDILAEHPEELSVQLTRLDVADHAGPSIALLMEQQVQAAHQALLQLLHVRDWDSVDERGLDEARMWLGTGVQLLRGIASASDAVEREQQPIDIRLHDIGEAGS